MNTHNEVKKLTMKMNFMNSLEPHMGSRSFPMKRRPIVLLRTCLKKKKKKQFIDLDINK